jgi:hypothetical protein
VVTGERTSDPEFMGQAFSELITSQEEFPIKVEGAKTTPYTSVLLTSDPETQVMLLKLFRPLPPALAVGATFELIFSAQGKRYEGRIALMGREGYLQYRFQWPRSLLSSDRRVWKRFNFRPRENVYAAAQDSEIPCNGLTGALTNLSQGGFLFRVDRMVRLEDGMPIRPWANLFPQGKVFSMVRIYGLTKSDVLEARGLIVRVAEADGEIQLAVQFQGLGEADKMLLSMVLEARERRSARAGAAGPAPGPGERTDRLMAVSDPEEEPEPAAQEPRPQDAGSEPLRALDRRTARILVIADPGGDQDAVFRHLQSNGFWHLEAAADPAAALAAFTCAASRPYRLLVVDLEPSTRAGMETVEAVRHLEPTLRAFGALPVAFVCGRPEPMVDLLDKPGMGVVAREDPDRARCIRVLDRLLG